jgi:hypothetical protein
MVIESTFSPKRSYNSRDLLGITNHKIVVPVGTKNSIYMLLFSGFLNYEVSLKMNVSPRPLVLCHHPKDP